MTLGSVHRVDSLPITVHTPGWYYDDLRQVGVNFEDVAEVDSYDERQGPQETEHRKILDQLPVGPGTRLVELGCGTAWLAIRAAQRGARVTAIDVSAAMLDAARQNARRERVAVEFIRGGFLSFRVSAPADVIVSKFALHHLSDFWKQVALLRISAMLRPGGVFFLRDVVFSFPPEAYAESIERWIAEMTSDESGYPPAAFETHVRDEHSTFAWVMRGLLEGAGFDVCENLWAPTYADYRCTRRQDGSSD
jgi:putative AdoMet-dependent methyltransferase